MGLNWLECLIYGLLSGAAEFLPISAEAHREIFLKLAGESDDPALRLAVHIGALLAVLISSGAYISKLNRERRLLSIPKRNRKRPPDMRTVLDLRLMKMMIIPIMLWFAVYPFVWDQGQRLWILALLLLVNGLLLYLPQRFSTANKDSRALSALDGILVGLVGGAGVIPGISRMGALLSVFRLRGADREFSLSISLLMFIPAAAGLILFDLYGIFTGQVLAFSFLGWLLAAISSFISAYAAIFCMRFLAVKSGFSGFAYYSWGAALLAMILYLVT